MYFNKMYDNNLPPQLANDPYFLNEPPCPICKQDGCDHTPEEVLEFIDERDEKEYEPE
jgi:hypothetical protein